MKNKAFSRWHVLIVFIYFLKFVLKINYTNMYKYKILDIKIIFKMHLKIF